MRPPRPPTYWPTRASADRSRPPWLFLMAVPLLAISALSLWIGFTDAATAVQVGQRLIGVVFLLCGSATLVTLGAIWRGHRTSMLLLTSMFAAVPGVLLTWVQLSAGPPNTRTLVWVAAAIIPLGIALVASLRAVERGLPRGRTLTSATGLAGLAALATLIGSTIQAGATAYAPVRQGQESLDVDVALEVVGQRSDLTMLSSFDAAGTARGVNQAQPTPPPQYLVLEIEVAIQNVGSERLMFLGGAYSLLGWRSTVRSAPLDDEWVVTRLQDLRRETWSSRVEAGAERTLVEVGYESQTVDHWIAPGQSFTDTWWALVRAGDYDHLSVEYGAATARPERLRLGVAKERNEVGFVPGRSGRPSETAVYSEWPVQETSLVSDLTREPRFLRVEYNTVTQVEPRSHPSGMEVTAYTDSEERRTAPDFNTYLDSFYGIANHRAVDTISLVGQPVETADDASP